MKTKLRKLKEKAEQWWKGEILKRDKKCRRCGSKNILQAHHIKSRVHSSTFYNLGNGVLLCRDCHCWVTFADDEDRRNFHISMVGESKYLELCAESRRVKKYTVSELEELIKGCDNGSSQQAHKSNLGNGMYKGS